MVHLSLLSVYNFIRRGLAEKTVSPSPSPSPWLSSQSKSSKRGLKSGLKSKSELQYYKSEYQQVCILCLSI